MNLLFGANDTEAKSQSQMVENKDANFVVARHQNSVETVYKTCAPS